MGEYGRRFKGGRLLNVEDSLLNDRAKLHKPKYEPGDHPTKT